MNDTDTWETWLRNVSPEMQNILYGILKGRFNGVTTGRSQSDYSNESNGPKEESGPVAITKTPVEDLMVTTLPPYLDVFNLHGIYKALAFKSNILLKGPKGDGKSLSVLTYAHATQTPIIIQECSEDTKKMDMMGSQTLLGNDTIFTLGCIPAAIETANEYGRAILLFEELSALTPQVQKQLNAVTDFRKQCSMPFLGKTYKLKQGAFLWVVGTMNPSVYGGTYDLNEDLKSRFEELEVTYPEAGQEKKILQLACAHVMNAQMPFKYVSMIDGNSTEIWNINDTILNLVIKLAGETRQQATGYALSTRDLVRIVETMAVLGVESAIQLVLCKFEGEEDKGTMKKRIGSIFHQLKIKSYWT